MDLIDDPSSSKIIALFELPGVKNDNITLQIREGRLVVFGSRLDPFSEALAAAAAAAAHARVSDSEPVDNMQVDSSTITTTVSVGPSRDSAREIRYGTFYRAIPVPGGIKQSEVTAGLQDGMLTVTWPRVPAAARSVDTPPGSNPTSGGEIAGPQMPNSRELASTTSQ